MTLSLEIVQPNGPVVQVDALTVRAIDPTGSFGLLSSHEDFCTVLVPSILMYREVGGGERYVAVDGGVLLLEGGHVTVATRDAVLSEDMDRVAEAVAAMLRARREQEQEASQAFGKLVAELLEQLPQLRGSR